MAKKKNKKRKQQRPPGVDPNEKRRERLEEKRRQREAAAKAQRRAAFRERLVRGMVIAALMVAAIYFFFLRNQTPSDIGGFEVQTFTESGGHEVGPIDYPMTPPVTGQHSQSVAPCGVHSTQIEDELFVHSLEHGAIGILYDPQQVEVDDIGAIESLVGEFDQRTIAAPYSGTETPVTLTSWGEVLRLDDFDEAVARDYIDAFINKGPEKIDCPNDADDPFDPRSLEPIPGAEDGAEDADDDAEGQDDGGNDGDGGKKKNKPRDSDDDT